MIEVFDIGMKILFVAAPFFFLVFFILCIGWAEAKHPERNLTIGFLVSTFYTFWFILGGFFILILINLFLKYLLPLIKTFPS